MYWSVCENSLSRKDKCVFAACVEKFDTHSAVYGRWCDKHFLFQYHQRDWPPIQGFTRQNVTHKGYKKVAAVSDLLHKNSLKSYFNRVYQHRFGVLIQVFHQAKTKHYPSPLDCVKPIKSFVGMATQNFSYYSARFTKTRVLLILDLGFHVIITLHGRSNRRSPRSLYPFFVTN